MMTVMMNQRRTDSSSVTTMKTANRIIGRNRHVPLWWCCVVVLVVGGGEFPVGCHVAATTGRTTTTTTTTASHVRRRKTVATEAAKKKSPFNNNGGTRLIVHLPETGNNGNDNDNDKSDSTTSTATAFDHRGALFGPQASSSSSSYYYSGTSLVEPLYFADTDLCNPLQEAFNYYPTLPPPNYDYYDDPFQPQHHHPQPFLLLVNRGGCSFIQKVRNGQRLGAAAVLIADNLCVCHDKICEEENPHLMACQPEEPVLANDGSGNDITIPSFLIFKHDADRLKQRLKELKQPLLRVELKFPPRPGTAAAAAATALSSSSNNNNQQPQPLPTTITTPHPVSPIQLDLWLTPTDFVAQSFVGEFRAVLQAFAATDQAPQQQKNPIQFQLHFYLMDGVKYGCYDPVKNGPGPHCTDLCTNYGRYCAVSDHDRSSSSSGDLATTTSSSSVAPIQLTGADLVAESLRQLCIWNHDEAMNDDDDDHDSQHHAFGVPTTPYSEKVRIHRFQEGQIQGSLWWAYVTEFEKRCLGYSFSSSSTDDDTKTPNQDDYDHFNRLDVMTCVEHVYKIVGIDGSIINQCVNDSGGLPVNVPNALLEQELQLQNKHAIYALPTLYLNHQPYRQGPITARQVLQSICQQWQQEQPQPQHDFTAASTTTTTNVILSREQYLCTHCLSCPEWNACLQRDGICPSSAFAEASFVSQNTFLTYEDYRAFYQQGVTTMSATAMRPRKGGVSMGTFRGTLVLLVTLVVLGAKWHSYQARQERRHQVESIMADYVLLQDSSDNHDNGGDSNLMNIQHPHNASFFHDTNIKDCKDEGGRYEECREGSNSSSSNSSSTMDVFSIEDDHDDLAQDDDYDRNWMAGQSHHREPLMRK